MKNDFTYRELVKIALPIALQSLVISSVNMIDTFMIGQLGEEAIASVGIANQIFFLMALILFGVNSGSGIYYSQYFGKKDLKSLRKTMGVTLILSLVVSTAFFLGAAFLPEELISLYSKDNTVIAGGAQYLRIVSWGYMITSVSFLISFSLRSTGVTTPSLINSFISLLINGGLNYILIFGRFGAPAMGIKGAAIATLVARTIEFFFFTLGSLQMRYHIVGRVREYFDFNTAFVKRYFSTTSSVIINEIFWSLGMTMHSVVFARMGVTAIASYNITRSLEGLVYVTFIGLSSAAVVTVGQSIGGGDQEGALLRGKKIFRVSIGVGLVNAFIIITLSAVFLSLYKVAPEVKDISLKMMYVYSVLGLFRGSATVNLTGIMRSGGDTRYGMWADILTLWGIAVPLAVWGGLYAGMSPVMVYFLAQTDVIAKFVVSIRRLYSGRWIRDLVSDI